MSSEDELQEEEDPSDEDEVGLDASGWDPAVDAFLLEAVAEAPSLHSGLPDFFYVSEMFLEVLEPDPDQVSAARDRFAPQLLAERWLYLRSLPPEAAPRLAREEEEGLGLDRSPGTTPDQSQTSSPEDPPPEAQPSHDLRTSPPAERCELQAAAAFAPPSREAPNADVQPSTRGRDRVLEAMQGFLFGVPRSPSAATQTEVQCQRPDRPPSGAQTTIPSETKAEPQEEAQDGPPARAEAAGTPEAKAEPRMEAQSCHRPARGRERVESRGSRVPSQSEALRLCLDLAQELRRHGDELRHCGNVFGGDAQQLAQAATERRAALLRRLSGLTTAAGRA